MKRLTVLLLCIVAAVIALDIGIYIGTWLMKRSL